MSLTVERSRTAPPTSLTEGEVASLPEGLPPLASLLEEVRAPGAGRAEVDALLAGLSLPLPPGHSPRERADLLLSIIGDDVIASYTGTAGRTVRGGAILALMALGYPYALEVPPEALEAKSREEERTGPGILSTMRGRSGFGLVTLAGVLQAIAVVFLGKALAAPTFMTIALCVVAAMTLLPAILAVLGQSLGSRGLKKLGLVWLKVSAMLWGGSSIFSISALPFALVPLFMAAMIYFGAHLMDAKEDS
jgi:hypothetical protein